MRIVLTVLVRDEADVIDAQVAYHLNAGVDFVIATDHESQDGTTEILESYERDGVLRLIREQGPVHESAWRTRMARLAAAEHGADWVIDSGPREFWWPRAESLGDVLVAVPRRYGVVQALFRPMLPRPGDEDTGLFERMTVRSVVLPSADDRSARLRTALRPVFRASERVEVGSDGYRRPPDAVPLRAWYPVEVFRIPVSGSVSGGADPGDIELGLADGSLVVDTRLRDALATLEELGDEGGARGIGRRYAMAGEGLEIRPPDVVEDAAYAVECAALGEVDLSVLELEIERLEQRIAALEAKIWPRVKRRLALLLGRESV